MRKRDAAICLVVRRLASSTAAMLSDGRQQEHLEQEHCHTNIVNTTALIILGTVIRN